MTDTLGEVGESAVLARIFPRLPDAQTAILGPGDDAALLAAPDGRVVITTDTMVHGPDFRWAWSTPGDLGWKAAATNLSDIAAMGARPTALVVAVVAPSTTEVRVLEELADGFREACAALAPGCGVIGGDLSVSDTFTIAVTAFGDLEGREAVLRSGARPGDAVAVSGALGLAAEGLARLFGLSDGDPAPPSEQLRASEAVQAQLRPAPPIADGPRAATAGATAMLDVSDGLLLDATRLAAASGVRIDLDEPEHPLALAGGEDHALLAAFPAGVALPGGFVSIGRVLAGEGVTVGGRRPDGRGGWDPYGDWNGARG